MGYADFFICWGREGGVCVMCDGGGGDGGVVSDGEDE